MKNILIPLFTISILTISGCGTSPVGKPQGVACTMEARQCPDGSYVGRVGPKCEFAACPSEASCEGEACPTETGSPSTPSTSTMPQLPETKQSGDAKIGEVYLFEDIAIAPLKVTADSRCAVDVACVWAGTVKLEATLHRGDETTDVVFDLTTPTEFAGKWIALVGVTPEPHSKKTIAPSDYRFNFRVTNADLSPESTGKNITW